MLILFEIHKKASLDTFGVLCMKSPNKLVGCLEVLKRWVDIEACNVPVACRQSLSRVAGNIGSEEADVTGMFPASQIGRSNARALVSKAQKI